jgi:hypothetical protein
MLCGGRMDDAIMTGEPSPKQSAKKERAERLAAELRENLRKRKAQARARKGEGGDKDGGPDR